jgi:hypothetical protein
LTIVECGAYGARHGVRAPHLATIAAWIGARAFCDQSSWNSSFRWKISWKSVSRTASAEVLIEPTTLYEMVQPLAYAAGVVFAIER